MRQFLYRIQVARTGMLTDGPTPAEATAVTGHLDYLRQLVAKDVVLMAGRTLNADESTFGIVVFQVASEAEAMAVMQNDPAIQQSVMRGELFPYRVALWSAKGPSSD